MSANWQNLALAEAQAQGCDANIVLATIEAETGGNNILGDNGNAMGFGQVWPQWHNDAFVYAANKCRVEWPSDQFSQQQVVLGNDALSMAATVYVIKADWLAAGKDWRQFTLMYVGPAIPQDDYNRRYNIWLKYQGGNYPTATNLTYMNEGGSTTPSPGGAPGGQFDNVTIPPSNYGIVANSKRYGNILYGRRYRLIVSNANGVALDVSQLRCTFTIQKTINQQPNFSQIVIYNLNADTENALISSGDRIVIEAGYEGEQYGLIFDGDVIQPIRDKEDNVTYRLTLNSLDGDRFMNQGFVGFTLLKGQTARQQVQSIVSQAKIPTQMGSISDGFSKSELTRGKVVFGLAKDFLRQIAQSQSATFYVEDGKVNIIRADDLPEGEIVDLSPVTGLIDVPTQSDQGITFKCMLNPRIKINTLVHIDNSLIREQAYQLGQVIRNLDNDGIYRVISVNYVGDTRGDNWCCECQAVSQAGLIPSVVPSSNSNPY